MTMTNPRKLGKAINVTELKETKIQNLLKINKTTFSTRFHFYYSFNKFDIFHCNKHSACLYKVFHSKESTLIKASINNKLHIRWAFCLNTRKTRD